MNLVPLDEFVSFVEKAEEISPDPKDMSYIALALKLNANIWSNDKDLKNKKLVIALFQMRFFRLSSLFNAFASLDSYYYA